LSIYILKSENKIIYLESLYPMYVINLMSINGSVKAFSLFRLNLNYFNVKKS